VQALGLCTAGPAACLPIEVEGKVAARGTENRTFPQSLTDTELAPLKGSPRCVEALTNPVLW
jgi:hypothetical protein